MYVRGENLLLFATYFAHVYCKSTFLCLHGRYAIKSVILSYRLPNVSYWPTWVYVNCYWNT